MEEESFVRSDELSLRSPRLPRSRVVRDLVLPYRRCRSSLEDRICSLASSTAARRSCADQEVGRALFHDVSFEDEEEELPPLPPPPLESRSLEEEEEEEEPGSSLTRASNSAVMSDRDLL